MAEKFTERAYNTMFDLYIGYDEQSLSEKLQDLTTFQTPFGALCLVTLPIRWMNLVPIFHDMVTFILQPEIPEWTIPYIDDIPVKGPALRYMYIQEDNLYEVIKENPGIRQFIWEHLQVLNCIVQWIKYCGGTFSG